MEVQAGERYSPQKNLIDLDFNDFLPNFTTPEFYIHSNEEIEEINILLSTTSGVDAIGLVAWHWDEGNFPFWSPDSRFLGFFQNGKIKKIEIDLDIFVNFDQTQHSNIKFFFFH